MLCSNINGSKKIDNFTEKLKRLQKRSIHVWVRWVAVNSKVKHFLKSSPDDSLCPFYHDSWTQNLSYNLKSQPFSPILAPHLSLLAVFVEIQ